MTVQARCQLLCNDLRLPIMFTPGWITKVSLWTTIGFIDGVYKHRNNSFTTILKQNSLNELELHLMILGTSKVVCHRSTNMQNYDQIFRYAFVSLPKDSVKTQKNRKEKKKIKRKIFCQEFRQASKTLSQVKRWVIAKNMFLPNTWLLQIWT